MDDEELEVGIAAGLDVPTALALAEGDCSPEDCPSAAPPPGDSPLEDRPPDSRPPQGCLSVLAAIMLILSAAALLSF
jgi:hypothetical protein